MTKICGLKQQHIFYFLQFCELASGSPGLDMCLDYRGEVSTGDTDQCVDDI